MPTHPGDEFSAERLARKVAYNRARSEERARRQAEREARHQLEEQEHRRRVEAARKQAKEDARAIARDLAQHAQEQRHAAREALQALRADPVYDLYKRWGQRQAAGRTYDADVWSRRGRLQAVTDRTRYTVGGHEKRRLVTMEEIVDAEAKELGIDARDLPRQFERVRRQESAAHQLAREAEEARKDRADYLRQVRGAAA